MKGLHPVAGCGEPCSPKLLLQPAMHAWDSLGLMELAGCPTDQAGIYIQMEGAQENLTVPHHVNLKGFQARTMKLVTKQTELLYI